MLQRGMEEAPENGKELSHSAHANGRNEWNGVRCGTSHKNTKCAELVQYKYIVLISHPAFTWYCKSIEIMKQKLYML
jgi:hypothetical protein